MNYRSLVLVCALSCAPGIELEATEPASGGDTAKREQALLAPAQLDELLSPIALYPDPLVAIILPASTFPADVVLAARYMKGGGSVEAIDSQPWDDSVKSLARYPDVLKWMDENLAWTRQVGAAFALQPADTLTSTQRLRAAARAAGNLHNTSEQTVVVERETIRIVPAQPEVIYVPVYDPVWVYRPRTVNFYHPGPLVRFSTGYRTGAWLSYHCDWGYRTVVVINRPHRVHVWHNYPRWSCPAPSSGYYHHVWRPDPGKIHPVVYNARPQAKPAGTPLTQNLAAVGEPASPAIPPARIPAQTAPTRPARLSTPDRLPTALESRPAAAGLTPAGSPRTERRNQGIVFTPPPATSLAPAAPPALTPMPSRRIQSPTTSPSVSAPSGFSAPPSTLRPSSRNTLRGNETPASVSPAERSPAPQIRSVPAAGNPGSAAQAIPRSRSRPASAAERSPAAELDAEASTVRSRRSP